MKFTVSITIDDSTAMRTCNDVAEQLDVIVRRLRREGDTPVVDVAEDQTGAIRDADDNIVGEWSVK